MTLGFSNHLGSAYVFKMQYSFLFRDIMKNKVFYQHPNLMRALGMHETVMEVMVNVLGTRESKVAVPFHV